MIPSFQTVLDESVAALHRELGENLSSCCVYGSAVRGNAIEAVSDLNLLIILNQSTTQAHEAIERAIGDKDKIDPFILGKRGFERSVRAFATKFASIRRNYRVVYGQDPLAGLSIDKKLEKFLCEQAIRNLRLRLIYSFVTRKNHNHYDLFIKRNVTTVFVQFSEALRLEGIAVPIAFEARIGILEKEMKIDGQVLRDLLALKKAANRLSAKEATGWHERLFPQVDAALAWIEAHWPNQL
ncbi:MAG: hypothetical protein JWM04_1771 [Verrucomicrobiales bacterium]|nr:hypothetical protein [Verrucomicrobiales bacterium]